MERCGTESRPHDLWVDPLPRLACSPDHPEDLASRLVSAEAFHVASDSKRAKFWDVQRHLLCRLAERLADARGEPNPMAGRGGRGEPTTTRLGGDLKGLVIRTNLQREDSDVYDA